MYTIDGLKMFKSLESAAIYLVDYGQLDKKVWRMVKGNRVTLDEWEQNELDIWIRDYTLPF